MNTTAPQKTIDIIGFPMYLGADRHGVDLGPAALRIAGLAETLAGLGHTVADLGDVTVRDYAENGFTNPKLKHLDGIARSNEELARSVADSLDKGHFPLCIGGDHSMAIGAIAGIASHCRQAGKTLGIIWIDAHADMNVESTTPSGNIHGMPMAISLGVGNERLIGLMGFSPKVAADHCALIGVRKVDPPEREIIRNLKLPVYTMSDIDRHGIHAILDTMLQKLENSADHIHVSFDIDSVDPSVAMGVGTPVTGGLTYREAHLLMETIARRGCMSSLEVAEINPILDHKNGSAVFAIELVASSLGLTIL